MLLYKIAVAILKPIFCFLFRIKVSGKENLPDGAVVVCANHTSWLDPVVLAVGVGPRKQFRFMAKQEIFKNKMLAWLLHKIGVIPVNRESTDLSTIRTCLKVLKNGERLMMFPEGTRISEEKAHRENVKMGVGMIAARANAPILPVYISGNKGILRKTRIVIGKPMMPITSKGSNNENYISTALAVFDEIMRLKQEK